jgi:hypothetical protein
MYPKLGRREFLTGVAAMLGPGAALWGADEQVIPFLDSNTFNPESPTCRGTS